ncbi:putative tyrosin-phosphatase protein [Rutstroemia sp. NJR-2017a WRK4]|nr:putative tyrosin-phosphatase protein [Rutstroemia sp. NJR-2017a WRK4]
MSNNTVTIATLPRLEAPDLSRIILSSTSSNLDAPQTAPEGLAIIDVRDDDHIGGHIKHSTHIPSSTLDYRIPELVRKLQDKETVVFHCALSQQRGPSAALRYIRERERLLGKGVGVDLGAVRLREGEGGVEGGEEKREGKGEGEEGEGKGKQKKEKEQKVFVLNRGFVGWQEVYGEDTRLTEGYRKEIWQDGY